VHQIEELFIVMVSFCVFPTHFKLFSHFSLVSLSCK